MDDSVGIVRTQDGRWICDAHLISAINAIAPNRLEEKRMDRADDAMKRLQKKMDEQKARAGVVIDVDAVADGAMRALEGDCRLIEDSDTAPLLLDLTMNH